jgi:PhoH-like ATPase
VKNFVLDTNVLLHDSNCIRAFSDNVVNIPIYVIEELDTFKRDQSELGRNARRIARELDGYREQGNLREGVPLPSGGIVRVVLDRADLPGNFSVSHTMDDAILAAALFLHREEPHRPVTFVTKDTNLRIRGDALGLHSEDYDREGKELEELYTGEGELVVDSFLIDSLYNDGGFDLADLGDQAHNLFINQYLRLTARGTATKSAYARVTSGRVEHLRGAKQAVFGIQAKNREQMFALDMLLRDDIQLCTLVGKAGTGKTLLALAAGLAAVTEREAYRKLLVSRPIFPFGRDIGYLPGDIEEKLNPWMQPIHDNIDFLTSTTASSKGAKVWSFDQLTSSGFLEVEPLTYIRGRSLPGVFMIVDEAQNLTPLEVKTVLTRVGHGTKIILTGDPYQIDQPYLDSLNNGLTYVAERFKNEAIAAHMTLTKGERSPLAELAANLL